MSVETLIADGLTRLGQAGRVPEGAPALLARYGARLIEKNKVMNLTAITDPGDVATLHMLDCAALLNCAGFAGKTLIDVGTGAGFPGAPLAVLVPSLKVTLLDALSQWSAAQGVPPDLAARYVSGFFGAVCQEAAHLDAAGLSRMAGTATPGGINFLVKDLLAQQGGFQMWADAMEPALERLTANIPRPEK